MSVSSSTWSRCSSASSPPVASTTAASARARANRRPPVGDRHQRTPYLGCPVDDRVGQLGGAVEVLEVLLGPRLTASAQDPGRPLAVLPDPRLDLIRPSRLSSLIVMERDSNVSTSRFSSIPAYAFAQ